MQWIEWLQRRPMVAAALLGLLLGGLIGSFWPIQAGLAVPADTANWSLPADSVAVRFNEAAFAKVRSAPIWGAAGQAPGGTKLPGWRLTGIISRPAPAALIIAEGSTTMTRATVGDALPDGGKVLDVFPRGIAFERQGCRYQRVLYAPVDPAEAAGCPPAGAKTP